jgi:poly-gamma-glutamate synthesis protein (capsule biosynthesis protein)
VRHPSLDDGRRAIEIPSIDDLREALPFDPAGPMSARRRELLAGMSGVERIGSKLARREFLSWTAATVLGVLARPAATPAMNQPREGMGDPSDPVTLFLSGDVMTGRGIDQVLPHPGRPVLREAYARSALRYVELAEQAHGPIPRPVEFEYPWGDARAELDRVKPDARIINLETAVTRSDDHWPKGIHYRMHPDNVPCLLAAGIDCCAVANNHVLDWGYAGLAETLKALRQAGIEVAGAGSDSAEAAAPAILPLADRRRVVTFSLGSVTSGIPPDWAASKDRPGVNLVDKGTVELLAASVQRVRRPGDIVVASIHWGANWGYGIPRRQRTLAHALIDESGVDVVHGHSSHHPKGIEVYRNKPILYGCGDFLNDYEGIPGYEEFRGDLALMYFVTIDPHTRELTRLEMTPLQVRRFQLRRVSKQDARWLRKTLDRECTKLGTHVESAAGERARLVWD